jgi:hypothetical protein
MFDTYQIIWWLIEATLLGYCCTYRVFDNDTDRYVFAPIAGFASIHMLGCLLWMWSVPTYMTSFLFVGLLFLATIFYIRQRPKPGSSILIAVIGGTVIVALHGSLIPFSEKVFQAYPLDRFYYLGGSILFAKENFHYFSDAIARVSFNGDKRSFFLHPMLPTGLLVMEGRPAS